MRVDAAGLPRDNWEHFLRRRDLEQVMLQTVRPIRPPILEVGCGDGYLSGVLRERFGDVVSVDPAPRADIDGVYVARAEDLPFPDRSFSTVFSSNVLEHIGDLPAGLAEMRRVLADDGLMVHTMPTTTWKALQFGLLPVQLAVRAGLPRLGLGRAAGGGAIVALDRPQPAGAGAPRGFPARLGRLLWPPVHGVARTHREEVVRFRVRSWRERFSESGLEVLQVRTLFLHSPYRLFPFRFLRLRDAVSRAGVGSVVAYWVVKRR